MYKEWTKEFSYPAVEEEIGNFWDRAEVFKKTLDRKDAPLFVFYEGPPTANGKPGIHHVMARLIKDLVCRYKTMRGYYVPRKAGWDTHGLPVEIEVEKKLGLKTKKQILEYGVAAFIEECRKSVFQYTGEWERMTKRIGYWLDMNDPYITCDNDYIESVWWILKQYFDKGLIYKGYKVIPYCPRCETPLSSHEVSQGYRNVKDPSVYVRFRLEDEENTSFLVWTTTPWTLISNVALAVGNLIEYVKVELDDEYFILAKKCLDEALDKDAARARIVETFIGNDLIDKKYRQLFPFLTPEPGKEGFRVVSADFVSLDEGTGIVHMAPAFGQEDYELSLKENLPLLNPVNEEGRFSDEVTAYAGKFVRDADPDIIYDMKKSGILYRSGKIEHSYPFCWRCESPLIYYARPSWYIRTTAYKDRMVDFNRNIKWYPSEVGSGRFGNWLENNVDYAFSRDRFWGTPLNLWVCEKCGNITSIGSIEELRKLACELPENLDLHKPMMDNIPITCPSCGGTANRTPEVIDCWFDSGSMPIAQYHYPFENKEKFKDFFPAEFISEAIDQTRGWFYSLLAISSFIFDELSFREVLVTELILDKEGKKMSKSHGNAVDPWDIINKNGADPLRWYLLTTSPPWVSTRFDPDGVMEVQRKLFDTLKNTYSFFAMYANIDGFSPAGNFNDFSKSPQIDRWILAKLHILIGEVMKHLESYNLTKAATAIEYFIIEDLSNWYIRRSRRRFWKKGTPDDKISAYETLYHVLIRCCGLLAPMIPHFAEEIYCNLRTEDMPESIHLTTYPEKDESLIDMELVSGMDIVRKVVFLARAAREGERIKVRQPLSKILVKVEGEEIKDFIRASMNLIREEINIKELEFIEDESEIVKRRVSPVFSKFGPKFGKHMKAVAELLEKVTAEQITELENGNDVVFVVEGVKLTVSPEDVTIEKVSRENMVYREDGQVLVALDILLTGELIDEGFAREFVNRVQNMRKEAGFDVVDHIRITFEVSEPLKKAIKNFESYICEETLSDALVEDSDGRSYQKEVSVNGEEVRISLQKI